MSSVGQARERVEFEWRSFQDQWATTSEQWRDAVGARFAREFWQEYEAAIPSALGALARLEEVLATARREVK
jgi:hypothetical protein